MSASLPENHALLDDLHRTRFSLDNAIRATVSSEETRPEGRAPSTPSPQRARRHDGV
jgi:hypothetical protein